MGVPSPHCPFFFRGQCIINQLTGRVFATIFVIPWDTESFTNKDAYQSCIDIIEVIQCFKEAYILYSLKVSRHKKKHWLTKDCENYQNLPELLIRPQTTQAVVNTRNHYDSTITKTKVEFSACIGEKACTMVVDHFGLL